jgi:SPP1 gp7 family putative phage head morphogenesis protein
MRSIAASKQQEAIRRWTERSRAARDKYAADQVAGLTAELKRASDDVRAEMRRFEETAERTPGQAARLKHLKALKQNIDKVGAELEKRLTLLAPGQVEGAVKLGVRDGIDELRTVKVPSYTALTPPGLDKLAATVFSRIDKQALDFLVNFRLELMGDVADQLKRDIKSRISSGIVAGKSIPDISRDIGEVITDKDAFRKAGRTVFKSAQYRVEMIARTETLRAHNQGRLKFYEQAGVKKVKWITAHDERTCPECGPMDGKVFDLGDDPGVPHPRCRCSRVAVVL